MDLEDDLLDRLIHTHRVGLLEFTASAAAFFRMHSSPWHMPTRIMIFSAGFEVEVPR